MKVLYIGIETYGWYHLADVREWIGADPEVGLRNYLDGASKSLRDLEFLGWWKGGRSPFWRFVLKTHARLRGVDYARLRSREPYDADVLECLQSLAWGNTWSCERFKTIRDYTKKDEETVTLDDWSAVQTATSASLDRLGLMLDAVEPALCVITNWGLHVETFLRGLEWETVSTQKHFEHYRVVRQERTVDVLRTCHPRYMPRAGGTDHFVQLVIDTMEKVGRGGNEATGAPSRSSGP